MFSLDTQRGGFATIAIIGGTVVAVAVGGVFYFLRSSPVEVDTTLKEDSVALISDRAELSVDAERSLLRGLPRGQGTDYCSILGLDRTSCVSGAADACQDLFGACSIDLRRDTSETKRLLAEACLVLGDSVGREMYFAWLDSDDPSSFPLYYAIFGLSLDTFGQKSLSDAYREMVDLYFATSSCDNRDAPRLLTEGYLVLSNSEGRALYNEWIRDGASRPFPRYCASLGLREDTFTPEKATDAYETLLSRYFAGFYGSNAEILRLLTEAYMVLTAPSSLSTCNGDLGDGSLSTSSDSSFDFGVEDLASTLSDLDLSPSALGSVLGSFALSPVDLTGLLTTTFDLSPSDLGALLGNLNLPPSDLGALLGNLNLSPSDLGALLGNLNLPPSDLGALLGNLNLSLPDLGALLGNLNLSPSDLGALLGNLNLPPSDLGALLGNLNLSPSDLGALLGNLNLSPSDLGALLGNLNLPPSDLGALLGNLNLPPSDLGALLGNLNLSPSDLGALLGNLNLSPSDLAVIGSTLTLPSSGSGDSFTGVTVRGDGSDGSLLPIVTISASPRNGQIGVLSDTEPSFVLEVTQGGSSYIPDTPLSVVLSCSQSVDADQAAGSLISSTLPTSATLSDSAVTIDLQKVPDVTGSVTCSVVADASTTDPAYAVGSPGSAIINVVGGSSPLSGDRPSDDLPFASITALAQRVDSGEDAVFRVSANRDLILPLRVKYSCTGVAGSSEGSVRIVSGSGGFSADIRVQTASGASGYVRCELEDDVGVYTVRERTASVGVGLLRLEDVADDPTLPTVSLIAYRAYASGHFIGLADSALVDDENTYFGFVIDGVGVGMDSFGTEVPGSRVSVTDSDLYVLTPTDFGATVSVLPDPVSPGSQAINIGITSDREVPFELPPSGKVARPSGYVRVAQLRQHPYPQSSGGGVFDYAGTRISIETQRFVRVENGQSFLEYRVVARKGTGETVVCGYDGGVMSCAMYRNDAPVDIRVTARCYKDFLDGSKPPEVSDVLVGGRYYDQNQQKYAVRVRDYRPGDDDPAGELYQFVLPGGGYISADEDREGEVSSVFTPFIEPDVSFSCEIVGGVEDGYNVGKREASVRVYARSAVSIEPEGPVGVGDADPVGAPVATVPYGKRQYTSSQNDPFYKNTGLSRGSLSTSSSVSGGLLQSLGVGFLTSFGSCVGANVFNNGIGALLDIGVFGGLGKQKVSIEDETSDTKECHLDSAASEAAMQVLTAITRDYIVWANEGFDGKPLFVRNPTTFYKNLRDNVIGRVIDRSGLGFLCDVGFGQFDASLTARVSADLQQRYFGLDTVQPRCTYNDLTNNLSAFYDDASSFLSDFNPRDLVDLGFTVTARTQYGGTVLAPLSDSESGNQLDELSANLERDLGRVQSSDNLLLSLVRFDDEVSQAEQDFDVYAKPGAQLFNPDDPTSVAAFQECSEAENPEGSSDCFLVNVSGTRISASTNKALDTSLDRLLNVDEYGEIGQLVKLAANATSAGLMKKYLRDGFGVKVARETTDILTDIADSFLPYGTDKVGLGGMWWSAFFQSNDFYQELLGADLYAGDVSNLLQYINFSFYDGGEHEFPPTAPYNDFYTVHPIQNPLKPPTGPPCRGYGPCAEGYSYLKDTSQSVLSRHFNYYIQNTDNVIEEGGRKSRGMSILNQYPPRGYVKAGVFALLADGVDNEPSSEARKEHRETAIQRFKNAYRFLSISDNRQQYNAFVDSLGVFSGVVDDNPRAIRIYRYAKINKQDSWIRASFPRLPVPAHYILPTLLSGFKNNINALRGYVWYPLDLERLRRSLLLSSSSGSVAHNVARSREESEAITSLRGIYEATLLAHIHLVGLVDEYDGDPSRLIDSPVYTYRQNVLAGKDHSSAFERWLLVRDATLKKFRDGTMSVYVPLEDGQAHSDYDEFLGAGCPFSRPVEVVQVNHPTTKREYRKTTCALGTVFQDQAYFVVRRENAGYPDLLNKSLQVTLACGYADPFSTRLDQHQFADIPNTFQWYPITLYPNQDAVLVPVPKISSSFDSGNDSERPRFRNNVTPDVQKVRCSIVSAQYAGGPAIDLDADDDLTATVTVSEYEHSHNTFHTLAGSILRPKHVPDKRQERIDRISAALYYLYLWGWHTGFIEMPYYSIQGLLSSPPVPISGEAAEFSDLALQNQEKLQQYRLLASLFVDESDKRFSAEHFGFLTPQEAYDTYQENYSSRFDAHFGHVLGRFLQELPPPYRQQ